MLPKDLSNKIWGFHDHPHLKDLTLFIVLNSQGITGVRLTMCVLSFGDSFLLCSFQCQ